MVQRENARKISSRKNMAVTKRWSMKYIIWVKESNNFTAVTKSTRRKQPSIFCTLKIALWLCIAAFVIRTHFIVKKELQPIPASNAHKKKRFNAYTTLFLHYCNRFFFFINISIGLEYMSIDAHAFCNWIHLFPFRMWTRARVMSRPKFGRPAVYMQNSRLCTIRMHKHFMCTRL